MQKLRVCAYTYIYIYFLVSAERAQTWFLNTFPIKGGPEEIQLITRMWQREDKVIPKLLIVLQNKCSKIDRGVSKDT